MRQTNKSQTLRKTVLQGNMKDTLFAIQVLFPFSLWVHIAQLQMPDFHRHFLNSLDLVKKKHQS